MPTYEYRCEKGHTFERIQKMNDKPVAKCPVCGAKAARMISGGQGLIFKGSGFYITDYGKDGKGPRKDPDAARASESKAESKAEAKGEAKGGAKGEDKGEAKAEPKGESKVDGPAASKGDSKLEARPASAPKPGKSDAS